MSDFCVHIRHVFTLRNEWILCASKKRNNLTGGVTLVYMCEYVSYMYTNVAHSVMWIRFLHVH